jgi:hypothetical protein
MHDIVRVQMDEGIQDIREDLPEHVAGQHLILEAWLNHFPEFPGTMLNPLLDPVVGL